MLFSEVLLDWWTCNQINLNMDTIYKKQMTIDKHILPFFENKKIDDINELTIVDFITYERTYGNRKTGNALCQNSIIKEVNIIKNVMAYAKLKGYIENNPFDLLPTLKRERVKEFEIFTKEEVEKIIGAVPQWFGDMIGLAYHTGMRKCECFGLQWKDIDFKNKSLTIRRSVTAVVPHQKILMCQKLKILIERFY